MRKLSILLAASAMLSAPAFAATNLVTNGGFEAGFAGFTSDYTPVLVPGPMAMYPEGTYTVADSSSAYHNLWADVSAYEGELFFIANGSGGDDLAAWEQTLNGLVVGTTYKFSAYAVNVCCNSSFTGDNSDPFIVAVKGNGGTTNIATTMGLGGTGNWTEFTGNFIATSATATLTIFDDNSVASGNDYGLDQISVTAVPEPASWAMMIAGFGLVGAAARSRLTAKTVLA